MLRRFGVLLVGVLAGVGGAAFGQQVTAVAALDLNRFTGTWFEVARLPDKAEKKCVANAIVLYALADKKQRFQVVSSCQVKDGTKDVRNQNGKMDKLGDGRLKVSTIWPFSTKQWVLAVDPANQWALVGSPNHKTLWVLSRSETLDPVVLTPVEAKAAAEGFNVGKMVTVKQD
jgi:apolipoprotein D and lipocalin family protein